jgi:hypothetical protein
LQSIRRKKLAINQAWNIAPENRKGKPFSDKRLALTNFDRISGVERLSSLSVQLFAALIVVE